MRSDETALAETMRIRQKLWPADPKGEENGDYARLTVGDMEYLRGAYDALCWVLQDKRAKAPSQIIRNAIGPVPPEVWAELGVVS